MRDWAEVRSRLEDFLKFPHEGGLSSDIRAALQRERLQAVALDLAWGLIANAGGGNWDRESQEWKAAAEEWRDDFWPEITADVAEWSEAAALRQRVEELERRVYPDDLGIMRDASGLSERCHELVGRLIKQSQRAEAAEAKLVNSEEGHRWLEAQLREAEAKLAKVVELHQKTKEIGGGYSYNTTTVCAECEQEVPCPTLAAAKGE